MAFFLDFEVEKIKAGFRIHCASLSDTWKVIKNQQSVIVLVKAVSADQACMAARVPANVTGNSDKELEAYLNQVGCTPAVLRKPEFHDFLETPQAIKDGLLYATDKPLGDVMFEAQMMLHPRFVRRVATARVVRVTRVKNGGNVIILKNVSDLDPIGVFKITVSSKIGPIHQMENAFAMRAGKRQWVIQGNDYKSFSQCLTKINDVLVPMKVKPIPIPGPSGGPPVEAADAKSEEEDDADEKTSLLDLSKINAKRVTEEELEQLKGETDDLQQEYDQLLEQIENAKQRKKAYLELQERLAAGETSYEAKVKRQIDSERKKYLEMFGLEIKNLKAHISELKPQLKANAAVENIGELANEEKKAEDAKSKKSRDEDDDQVNVKEFEDVVEIDSEGRLLKSIKDREERRRIRFKHMHVHKHKYTHNHMHTHVHLDNEALVEMDQKPEELFQDKHTVRHTICHTNVQYLVPKRWF